MDMKDKLIEKAKLFQDKFDKTHQESWNLSRHGIAVIMAEFALSLDKQVEQQESRSENEHDLIFKQDEIIKKQDNFLNYLLKYCGTSQRIRQYQSEIIVLKTK